jgi:hypothetical protein
MAMELHPLMSQMVGSSIIRTENEAGMQCVTSTMSGGLQPDRIQRDRDHRGTAPSLASGSPSSGIPRRDIANKDYKRHLEQNVPF